MHRARSSAARRYALGSSARRRGKFAGGVGRTREVVKLELAAGELRQTLAEVIAVKAITAVRSQRFAVVLDRLVEKPSSRGELAILEPESGQAEEGRAQGVLTLGDTGK